MKIMYFALLRTCSSLLRYMVINQLWSEMILQEKQTFLFMYWKIRKKHITIKAVTIPYICLFFIGYSQVNNPLEHYRDGNFILNYSIVKKSGQSGGVARTGQMAVWPEMLFTQVPVWFIIPMNTIVLSIINHRIQPQPYLN